jgi:hypothetical protein
MEPMYRFVCLFLVLGGAREAAEPSLNRKVAVAANTLGMQRYRAGELRGAAEQFRVAIDSDASYVVAHYNLACVASRVGDTSTALKELTWLSEDKDPMSRAKLEKAKSDPDLDYVSSLPAARELLGLPAFEKTRPSVWLTERSGTWSTELPDAACSERSYTVTFKDDGNLSLKVHEKCGDKLADGEFHGKLSLTPVSVVVSDWKQWPGDVPLSFTECPGLSGNGACFILAGSKSQLGPFHRGLPLPRDPHHRQLAGPIR